MLRANLKLPEAAPAVERKLSHASGKVLPICKKYKRKC